MLKLNTLSGFGSGVSGGAAGATYGYTQGGNASLLGERMVYATSVQSAHTDANLSQGKENPNATSDTTLYGYTYAGGAWEGAGRVRETDRTTLATSVTAAHTDADLSTDRYLVASTSDSTTYGYACGGSHASGNMNQVTGDRTVFATSVTSAHTDADLTVGRQCFASVSDTGTYGYVLGGYSPTAHATDADRITFSTSTAAAHTDADIPQGNNSGFCVTDGVLYGYHAGGHTGSYITTVNRLVYSTSVLSAHTDTNLSQTRMAAASHSDNAVYGYCLGGNPAASKDDTDRITFSTAVFALNTDSDMVTAMLNHAGFSDGSPS